MNNSLHKRYRLKLINFFLRLVVKEWIYPSLNVRPLVAECFITENCNLRCVSCACWHKTTTAELNSDEWIDIISQLKELGFIKINFTGGEPLLRKDIYKLIRHARDEKPVDVHLNTNAFLLNSERLEKLLDLGVTSFNISIDGPTAELHNQIRGRKDAFQVSIENLKRLLGYREKYKLKVRMNFTVMKSNYHMLPEMGGFAKELGVKLYLNLVTDRTFLFKDEAVSSQTRVDPERLHQACTEFARMSFAEPEYLPAISEIQYAEKHFKDIVQSNLPCAESQLKLMIHSQGQIGGCWGHDPEMNIRDNTIRQILISRQYIESHKRFYKKHCNGCGSNYSLNLRWRPKTWLNNLFWRYGLKRYN